MPTSDKAKSLERLLTINDLARFLATSRRTIERERAAGRLPKPCLHVGTSPRWRPDVIRRWTEEGGCR
jgi:predicted DNA-binding transcriptional regulator AlpA